MDLLAEAGIFLFGTLVYAIRGQIGRMLLAGLFKLLKAIGKAIFKFNEQDAALYRQEKLKTIELKRNRAAK